MLKKLIALTITCLLVVCLEAQRRRSPLASNPVCGSNRDACYHTQSCKCFCAYAGHPRDKVADDRPIFVADDPEENYCYCKERDLIKLNSERIARGEDPIDYTLSR